MPFITLPSGNRLELGTLPLYPISYVATTQADKGLILEFIQEEGPNAAVVARIGVPPHQLANLTASLVQWCARMSIDWTLVDLQTIFAEGYQVH